jgi:hypothetical protein
MFFRFVILALIVRLVLRLILTQFISRLYQMIAQKTVALLAQAALSTFKLTRAFTRPPETSVLGDGIFYIAQVFGPVTLFTLVPLLTLEKAGKWPISEAIPAAKTMPKPLMLTRWLTWGWCYGPG